VFVDTVNRSLRGSESKDEDMSAYVQAADVIVEAFNCAVVLVHHCGINGERPRGHTSLTGAVEAQLAVKRGTERGVVLVEVEFMKDGPEGDVIASRLDSVSVGMDEDGERITSCVISPFDGPVRQTLTKSEERLLNVAKEIHRERGDVFGESPISTEEWDAAAFKVWPARKGRLRLKELTAFVRNGMTRRLRLTLVQKLYVKAGEENQWFILDAVSAVNAGK
jgi:AAA domain